MTYDGNYMCTPMFFGTCRKLPSSNSLFSVALKTGFLWLPGGAYRRNLVSTNLIDIIFGHYSFDP
ncbi:hypothetical protein JM93_02403 [Roseibium hamelinense]|uniref:Uncharacterized protein n=1 Tax=Roseibium hamelinense TaxID=150831 RepID=A0A562T250_9HYPH|nr:hypothetical protein JM93_02403 [Roseibium hamelinense]